MPKVVHSIPGRARLRLDASAAALGPGVAAALLAHPDVTRVVWNPRVHSLTVHFDAVRDLSQLMASLRTIPALPPATGAEEAGVGRDWGRLLFVCALALVPVGPLGSVAVTLAISLVEESRRESRVFHQPAPVKPAAKSPDARPPIEPGAVTATATRDGPRPANPRPRLKGEPSRATPWIASNAPPK